jgi:hypothetical protein
MEIVTREDTTQATGEATGENTLWLTYHDLAARLGIKPASAKRRAIDRRWPNRRWPKRIGNDGRSLVAVPREIIEEASSEIVSDIAGEVTEEIASGIMALSNHLQTELEEVRRELRAAWAEAAKARDRAVRAEAEAELRSQAAIELRQELEATAAELRAKLAEATDARVRAAAAEAEGKGLREALAEARRPFWRRWIGS